MKNHALRLAMALVPTLALAFVSCGGGTDTMGVTISPSNVPDLVVGGTTILTATVQPDTAPDKTVRWSSSRPEVAGVEATDAAHATVTAVLPGTADITVTTVVGNKTATRAVTVKPPPAPTSLAIQTGLYPFVGIVSGETVTLTATVTPPDADQAMTWTSSDSTIATVEGNGATAILRGIGPGDCWITVTSQANPSVTASCQVYVPIVCTF